MESLFKMLAEMFDSIPVPVEAKMPDSAQRALRGLLDKAVVPAAEEPQAPEFQRSTGTRRTVEFRPRPLSAIQLLENNLDLVAKFLINHRVPFGYDGAQGEKAHLHLVHFDDSSSDQLDIGGWVIVQGKTGEPIFGYTVYSDEEYRLFYQEQEFTPYGGRGLLLIPDFYQGDQYDRRPVPAVGPVSPGGRPGRRDAALRGALDGRRVPEHIPASAPQLRQERL